MMALLLHLFLFSAFFLGWCLWLFHRLRLPAEQTPVVAMCALSVVTYLFGLVNLFGLIQPILYAGGILLGLWTLFRQGPKLLRRFVTLPMIGFGLVCGWFMLLLRGAAVEGHDNFAHWAIVAKSILTHNAFPTAANTAVEYVSYPPGTAVWIKLVCDLLGTSDGTMLFAHIILNMACILALIPLCRRSLPVGAALVAYGIFSFLQFNGCGSLMVDYLFTLLVLATAAVILACQKEHPAGGLTGALVLLCFTTLVKNSGLIFAVIGLVLALWAVWHSAFSRKIRWIWSGLLTLAPVGVWALWLLRVQLVYGETSSKHAVSVENYAQQISEKSAADIAAFQQSFFTYWLHPGYSGVVFFWITVALCIAVPLLLLAMGRIDKKRALLYVCGSLGTLAFYLFTLYLTYLLSMSREEMLVLASLPRYIVCFCAAITGLMLMALLWHLQGHKARPWAGGVILACCLYALFVCQPGSLRCLYSRQDYQNNAEQAPWIELREEYGLPEGASYLFYTNGSPVDGWTGLMVARYVFNTDHAALWQLRDDGPYLAAAFEEYEYVVFKSPDAQSDAELERWGFDPASTPYLDRGTFIQRQQELGS